MGEGGGRKGRKGGRGGKGREGGGMEGVAIYEGNFCWLITLVRPVSNTGAITASFWSEPG